MGDQMDRFGIEIINCENGYIVLEGNSIMIKNHYGIERRKWVVKTPEELGQVVESLAKGFIVSESSSLAHAAADGVGRRNENHT